MWGRRLMSTMSWHRLGEFSEGGRGGFGKEALVDGYEEETFPKDPSEMVKDRIGSGDERQVMGILGGEGVGWASIGHGIAVF